MSEKKLHVFFSHSHRDPDIDALKEIFNEACEEAEVVPVIVEPELGDDIAQKLRMLLLYCDLIVVLVSKPFSFSASFEVGFSQAAKLPILFLVDEKNRDLFNYTGFRYFSYTSHKEFFSILYQRLCNFRSQFKRTEAFEVKEDQIRILDTLKNSLRQNVLVLGKDSDIEGNSKIERIMSVLVAQQYIPVKLKDLPEITFLSPEDKMTRIGGLCRFVIAEDSRPSGHIDELRVCAECQYITATIREAGTAATWMQAHYPIQFSFMNRFCYCSKSLVNDSLCANTYDSLEKATEEAIDWAENRIKLQEHYFKRDIYSNFK